MFKKKMIKLALLSLSMGLSMWSASISTTVAPWEVNDNPVVAISPLAVPFWVNNFGDGGWVGTTAGDGTTNAAGTYIYTLDIGTYIGAAGTLSLQYAADNSVSWGITNGTLSGATSCAGPDCFSTVAALTGTFAADSVLTATVVNVANSPQGLLVVGTASDVSQVPEPASVTMIAIGGAAIALARLRRKK